MVLLVKPILFAFLKSDSVKQLIVDMLKKLVESTDNTIDDTAVELIKRNLFPNKKVTVNNG